MDDDTRGAGIELADTPEVKEAAGLALDAIKECYYEPGDWLEQSANRDAAHIIALSIAAGQFKANQRAIETEGRLRKELKIAALIESDLREIIDRPHQRADRIHRQMGEGVSMLERRIVDKEHIARRLDVRDRAREEGFAVARELREMLSGIGAICDRT